MTSVFLPGVEGTGFWTGNPTRSKILTKIESYQKYPLTFFLCHTSGSSSTSTWSTNFLTSASLGDKKMSKTHSDLRISQVFGGSQIHQQKSQYAVAPMMMEIWTKCIRSTWRKWPSAQGSGASALLGFLFNSTLLSAFLRISRSFDSWLPRVDSV